MREGENRIDRDGMFRGWWSGVLGGRSRGRGYRVKKWTYLQKYGSGLFLGVILCLKHSSKRILQKKSFLAICCAFFSSKISRKFHISLNFPILRKIPKSVRVVQSTWNLDRIIILMKETFPENFIKIRPQEGIFWKFLIFWQNLWSRGWGKIMKSTFPKSDFDEIFRKRFFYQYYDPVQISSWLHNSNKFWKFL